MARLGQALIFVFARLESLFAQLLFFFYLIFQFLNFFLFFLNLANVQDSNLLVIILIANLFKFGSEMLVACSQIIVSKNPKFDRN